MRLLAEKVKSLRIGWNKRALTEDDFHKLCKKLGVLLVEVDSDDMIWEGFYALVLGKPTIIINARLRGLERLWVLFHEMGHHLLHTPATCFFSDSTIEKAQAEANAFATIALLPKPMLGKMLTWNLFEDDCFPTKILRARLKILDQFKI